MSLNEDNLNRLNKSNQQNDSLIMNSISKIVTFREGTMPSKIESKKKTKSQDWEEISDVPSSLISDYEDIKQLR